MATMKGGRVRCCGRYCLEYKRRGFAFCVACSHSYDLQTGKHFTYAQGCWKCRPVAVTAAWRAEAAARAAVLEEGRTA